MKLAVDLCRPDDNTKPFEAHQVVVNTNADLGKLLGHLEGANRVAANIRARHPTSGSRKLGAIVIWNHTWR